MPLGSAISAGAGILGQFMGSRQQNRNVAQTNRANIDMANLQFGHNKEMAEYAFDKNLEMWHLQNQYNSPEQQMKRFEEAGLNKHMIHGLGSPGNASTSPTFESASFDGPNLDYSDQRSSMGDTLASVTGASSHLVELQTQKERLEQAAIQTWLSENTKYDKSRSPAILNDKNTWIGASQKIQHSILEIQKTMWDEGISPSDATWIRVFSQVYEKWGDLMPQWIKKEWEDFKKNLNRLPDILPNPMDMLPDFNPRRLNPFRRNL